MKNSNFSSLFFIFVLFLGPLRPYKTSPARTVPAHIPRPDYADHPDGIPLSEQLVKLSSHIKVLNDEEQEEMKIACKVFLIIHLLIFILVNSILINFIFIQVQYM